jgi:DNA polymerase-1
MNYLVFSEPERTTYPVCLLIPTINKTGIKEAYLDPFPGLDPNDVVVFDLHVGNGKKTPMAEIKAYIAEELVPALTELGVEHILVTDGEYFKALTKASKVEAHLGYIMDAVQGPWKVAYCPNHRSIFYDPDRTKAKISQGITAVLQDRLGNYQAPGGSIIHSAAYPSTPEEIEDWLERLIVEQPDLAADIEAFSLKHHTAGIGTISFAWNTHEGIAFSVDYEPIPGAKEAPFGRQVKNDRVRAALRSFFERYPGRLKWHGASYDVYVLIYQLWMEHILDTEGLLKGIGVMLEKMQNWDCTKLITYLATNSCAGNKLGLKPNSQEFAGNYGKDTIEDITTIPLPELLQYNLVDSLATNYVFNKHHPTMIADQQEGIYVELFKPALIDIIQMQLTGMPLNMKRVKEVKAILQADEKSALDRINGCSVMQQFIYRLEEKHIAKRNAELKKKQIKIGDEPQEFNPNSGPQLIDLFYEYLQLPVLAYTDSGLPATGKKTLKALRNHTQDPEILVLLDAFIDYKDVNKILTSFIPAMENAAQGPDGWHYLFGNFNLGGTLSGRLSSSDPNLQNLPATGSKYAKLIKSCFEAPPGWLFVGLDFASLEDKISGLTSKDPAKLKVYTDGYDGHSLRAFAYFRENMPDIRQSEGRRAFKISQQGETCYLLEGDEIMLPDGSVVRVEDAIRGRNSPPGVML